MIVLVFNVESASQGSFQKNYFLSNEKVSKNKNKIETSAFF